MKTETTKNRSLSLQCTQTTKNRSLSLQCTYPDTLQFLRVCHISLFRLHDVKDDSHPRLSAYLLIVVISTRLCDLVPYPVSASKSIRADIKPISNQPLTREYTRRHRDPVLLARVYVPGLQRSRTQLSRLRNGAEDRNNFLSHYSYL